jgi:hypothetical protein
MRNFVLFPRNLLKILSFFIPLTLPLSSSARPSALSAPSAVYTALMRNFVLFPRNPLKTLSFFISLTPPLPPLPGPLRSLRPLRYNFRVILAKH